MRDGTFLLENDPEDLIMDVIDKECEDNEQSDRENPKVAAVDACRLL